MYSKILGEIISCTMCNKVKAVQYCSEPFGTLRTRNSTIILVHDAPQYRRYAGICQECVDKNHYKVIISEENRLIQKFKRQVHHLKNERPAFMEKAVQRFAKTITPEFLESLNPSAVERYKNDNDYDALSMKHLPARRYVAEIKPELIDYLKGYLFGIADIPHSTDDSFADIERSIKKLLSQVEECNGYCQQIFFKKTMLAEERKHRLFSFRKRREEKKPWCDTKFKELCKGKILTDSAFYTLPIDTPQELQKLLKEAEEYRNQSPIERLCAFQWLLDTLPVIITENDFWGKYPAEKELSKEE